MLAIVAPRNVTKLFYYLPAKSHRHKVVEKLRRDGRCYGSGKADRRMPSADWLGVKERGESCYERMPGMELVNGQILQRTCHYPFFLKIQKCK